MLELLALWCGFSVFGFSFLFVACIIVGLEGLGKCFFGSHTGLLLLSQLFTRLIICINRVSLDFFLKRVCLLFSESECV